ncbi:cupin domain-containing protein [Parahaliea mediterranea]|uniref:Cupin domain-containing protein n=1 Tax=Parahaliea mediterranea TaxID=651086 RepID=A0A939DDT7_9GAMM|nr:cupin domain-containing protein [Parahaliea mediterranea]MBN7796209.1 cupin domain-containing protein [Parahaliea mediterranea]
MTMRQIITGHDSEGKAVFLSDEEVVPTEVAMYPGYKTFELWSTDGPRTVPHRGPFPGVPGYFPRRDGVVFRMIVLPPVRDGQAAFEVNEASVAELEATLPGFVEHLELDCPGMHTTDSVDFGVVLEGEIHLELDDGAERVLRAGDCVVQNGTRHAWRNRSGKPVTMAFVLLGADRTDAVEPPG